MHRSSFVDSSLHIHIVLQEMVHAVAEQFSNKATHIDKSRHNDLHCALFGLILPHLTAWLTTLLQVDVSTSATQP